MEERGFRNRHDWFTLAAAMVVWTAHFTLLWGVSIALPGHPAARWIAVALTAVAAGALYVLWRKAGSPAISTVSGLGLAVASAGVFYNMLPAIIG